MRVCVVCVCGGGVHVGVRVRVSRGGLTVIRKYIAFTIGIDLTDIIAIHAIGMS